MDQSALHATLATAQARLVADRAGALAAAGLPSGLAYLALPLLRLLATHQDQHVAGDLLKDLVAADHGRVLRQALATDLDAALRALDSDSPLGLACTALLDALGAEAQTPIAALVETDIGIDDHTQRRHNSDEESNAPVQQRIVAAGEAQIRDVVQAAIIAPVTGNVQIGNIYTRSSQEELNDYLARTVATYEAQMTRSIQRTSTSLAHPYKFLYAFELEDANIFFGRDQATVALHEKIRQRRLTILHARSGAGKTSLLSAGLLPRLIAEGYLPIYVRTHNDPVLAVKRALAPASLGPWPELLHRLTLHDLLGLVYRHLSRQVTELVIIFDQFEEFFVANLEHTARSVFIADMVDCHADITLPLRLMISIRGDYFTDLADFEPHLPYIFHNQYRVEPMSRSEALEAIQKPLSFISPSRSYALNLLKIVLDDLTRAGIELPHLQIVCTRLYESLSHSETQITLAHYDALGRAEGILRNYLRQEIEQLGHIAPLARVILTELVTPESTRQALPQHVLHERLAQRNDLAHLERVLGALVSARLLRRDDIDGVISYELAHDYLIGEIRAWVTQEDVVVRRARETLRRALANWREHSWTMDAAALNFVHQHRELLSNLNAEEIELLLRSAVAHQISIDTWALAAHRQGIDIWPILQPLLNIPAHRVRASVLAVLPVLGDAALPALRNALSDNAPLVRAQAILALERLGTVQAHEILRTDLWHELAIPADERGPRFYIDRYPVTNAAYQTFLEDQPDRDPPPSWYSRSAPAGFANHPVTEVNWEDAGAYAIWAGKRLPTVQEWCRAAGSAAHYHYPWGNHFDASRCNTGESGIGDTTPVGHYSPAGDSPSGVADMAGNVWEWLADPDGPDGAYRQLRGGAWRHSAEFAQIDYDCFRRLPSLRQDVIGFRLCFSLPSEE